MVAVALKYVPEGSLCRVPLLRGGKRHQDEEVIFDVLFATAGTSVARRKAWSGESRSLLETGC